MTDAQLRLECLRVAASLRVTQGTHLPSNLVPGIIADARSFADFVLGDDAGPQPEPLPFNPRAPLPDDIWRPGLVLTGGFRDGPASEP